MTEQTPKLRLITFDEEAEEDLAALRIDPSTLPPPVEKPTREARQRCHGRQFTRFEQAWTERLLAAKTTDGLWRLSLILLQKADFRDSFPVTSALMAEAGLNRQRKQAFLASLENLGLVKVTWRGPKSPMVRLLNLTNRRVRGGAVRGVVGIEDGVVSGC